MDITPKQFNIFADFKHLADCVTEAVQLLDAMVRAGAPAGRSFEEIQKLEHMGDDVMRRAMRQLDRQLTDVVPREDVFRLFSHLDTILDTIEGLAGRLAAFELPVLPNSALRLMGLIQASNDLLGDMIEKLGERRHFSELVAQMGDLENEADEAFQYALATLFQTKTDSALLIKHNEVYNLLDRIVDQFEDCAKALEDAALKHF